MRPFDIQSKGLSGDHPDPEILERYWFGEVTSEEKESLERWLLDNPEWRSRYSYLLNELSQSKDSDFSQSDINRLIDGVYKTVNTLPQSPEAGKYLTDISTSKPGNTSFWNRAWSGVAGLGIALTAVLIVFGVIVIDGSSSQEELRQEYITGIGQRMTFMLPDGSKVTLAPNTTVQVESSFGVSTRNVSVSGEAYFDVVSQSSLPFVVKVEKWQTRVLGTQFVVRKYGDDAELHVAVRSGRVSTGEAGQKSTVLDAGMVASINGSTAVVSDTLYMASYTDWINGQLIFKNTPLQEALKTLHRWYGAQFSVADSSLLPARITGTISHGSLDEMVQLLEALLNVSLEQTRHKDGSLLITIKP